MGPRPVDDAVDQGPAQPAAERGRIPELIVPAPRGDQRLLGAVLGRIDIAGQARGQPDEPWELGQEDLAELGVAVALTARGGSFRAQLRRTGIVRRPSTLYSGQNPASPVTTSNAATMSAT